MQHYECHKNGGSTYQGIGRYFAEADRSGRGREEAGCGCPVRGYESGAPRAGQEQVAQDSPARSYPALIIEYNLGNLQEQSPRQPRGCQRHRILVAVFGPGNKQPGAEFALTALTVTCYIT